MQNSTNIQYTKFDLQDNFYLTNSRINLLQNHGIFSNSELISCSANEIQELFGITIADAENMLIISRILDQNKIPVWCQIPPIEPIWIENIHEGIISNLVVLDQNDCSRSYQNVDVDVLFNIGEKCRLVSVNNQLSSNPFATDWTLFLNSYTLLGHKNNHDYIYSKISGRRSQTFKTFDRLPQVKYERDNGDKIQRFELEKHRQLLIEVREILRSLTYVKQSRKSWIRDSSVRNTPNNPPKL